MQTDVESCRENAPHETSQRTEMEQAHTIPAQVIGSNPETLEFVLDLIWPRMASYGLLRIPGLSFAVVILARLPALAHCARFASGLEPRRVQLRDAAARLGTLASHIKALLDASARGG
jgi:hypothetical protein